jgi:FKBP-type peptidyl-prolyl cis-trans isomerase
MQRRSLPAILTLITCVGQAFAQAQPQPEVPQPAPPSVDAPPPVNPTPEPRGPIVRRQELEGGLIIEDVRIGTGAEVPKDAQIVMDYSARLKSDGKEFKSTYAIGQPMPMELRNAIKGLKIGVPGMRLGGMRRITVPAALAFGAAGVENGKLVPPNADVVYLIEAHDMVRSEDLVVGEGDPLVGRFAAVGTFTIQDVNGKILEGALDPKSPYIWVHGEYQPMDFALEGMKPGGKRRIEVPKEFALSKGLGKFHPVNQRVIIEFNMMQWRSIDVDNQKPLPPVEVTSDEAPKAKGQ